MSTATATSERVDRENPWPGLATFSEEQQDFFFGRDDEARELARRLERKTLTILFGQSGLGKSSLLQAGVFPRLRTAGFVPVYVRLDHGVEAPPLAEQIKTLVFAGTSLMGTWTRARISAVGESLWEFFHHRDDVLRSGSGRQLVPVLVFDQFEELFTLGAADEAARSRARHFLGELADLAENRAPASFEARIEAGGVEADDYDFTRSDYRVLITLREDYLPHLESLRSQMPSLMQNRMRLTRLSGAQALEAVTMPAPGLVPEEVARAIVAFVAGRSEAAQAEVEPSLLSLVCRELNFRRQAAGAATIDAALLEGSRETILAEFYERTLADQPPAVRHWVENELLTDSGYRENVALERARKSLLAANADPGAIDALVSRRLLRIEERLDVRRVELTHDVLCPVVRASRDHRREREAHEAEERRRREAEAALARARAEEAAAQRALLRARVVAAGCAVLALAAVAAAVWGLVNLRRATAAETAALAAQGQAQRTRLLAESARGQAEQLLSYLLNDFSSELKETGRIALFERLVRRTVDYYEHLPKEIVTAETERNHAAALSLLGYALNVENRTDASLEAQEAALGIFRHLIAGGDRTRETARFYAGSLRFRAELYGNQLQSEAAQQANRDAVAVLRPFMAKSDVTPELRAVFAGHLMALGWSELEPAAAERAFGEAAETAAAAGGSDLKNEAAASTYAISLKGLAGTALARGDMAASLRYAERAIAISAAVLQRNPALAAMIWERASEFSTVAITYMRNGQPREALAAAEESSKGFDAYLALNPDDARVRGWAIGNENIAGIVLFQLGRLAESRAKYRAGLDGVRGRAISGQFARQLAINAGNLAGALAEAHDSASAREMRATFEHFMELARRDAASESLWQVGADEFRAVVRLNVEHGLGHVSPALFAEAKSVLARLEALRNKSRSEIGTYSYVLVTMQYQVASMALELGRPEEAEKAARAGLAALDEFRDRTYLADVSAAIARASAIQAEAMALQGRRTEARAFLVPVIARVRAEFAAAAQNQLTRAMLAQLLLVQAKAQEPDDREARRASLAEAASLAAGLTDEMQDTATGRRFAAQLAAERTQLGD